MVGMPCVPFRSPSRPSPITFAQWSACLASPSDHLRVALRPPLCNGRHTSRHPPITFAQWSACLASLSDHLCVALRPPSCTTPIPFVQQFMQGLRALALCGWVSYLQRVLRGLRALALCGKGPPAALCTPRSGPCPEPLHGRGRLAKCTLSCLRCAKKQASNDMCSTSLGACRLRSSCATSSKHNGGMTYKHSMR